MSYLRKRDRRNSPAFKTQFAVANVFSGTMITMGDDGCGKDGTPNNQRQALLNKLQQMDDDGDPIFILNAPKGEYPQQSIDGDALAVQKVCRLYACFSDVSRAEEYETLGDKWKARGIIRAADQGKKIELPAIIADQQKAVGRVKKSRLDKEAAGAVKQ